ncbi:MAG: tRNA (adenosine(37)-N6)-threonylcarbamoyltransferase complex dimerization subunit type 1 TsaB [Nitrospirales bacterium]|nr:MAG: tRNA (adenosine(37)-N6)-threonylcarbamoyltransferase complex dimerization subunit type 1 TsaB [Nitrospirales bacterium]
MRILAVETATSQQSVAILEDSEVLGSQRIDAQGSHTRRLIPTIDALLQSLQLKLVDMTGLAVSIGPGSFTGLRAGLATMTGFRVALNLPLVTVPTLEAMAWNFRVEHQLVYPMLKARSNELYWAGFRWEMGELRRVTDDQVGSIETLLQSLKEPVLSLGEGWLHCQHAIKELSPLLSSAPSDTHMASAVSVGLASLQRFASGDVAAVGVTPRYILPPYAEIQKRDVKSQAV